MNVNKNLFGLGLVVVFVAAVLLLVDVIGSGIAGTMAMIGIVLLAASGANRP